MKIGILAMALFVMTSPAMAEGVHTPGKEDAITPVLKVSHDFTVNMTCSEFLQTAIADQRTKVATDETNRRVAELSNIMAPYIIGGTDGKPLPYATEFAMKGLFLYCLAKPDDKLQDGLNDLKKKNIIIFNKVISNNMANTEKMKNNH